MTEDNKDIIMIDPRKCQSGHMAIIPKCGTAGHHQIIKEMFIEEIKKTSDDARERRKAKEE